MPKKCECGEEIEYGNNYCPICGKCLTIKAERRSEESCAPLTGSETGIGYATNTARLVQNGERRAVKILIETSIREKKRLQVLIAQCLRAASRAEFDVSTMSDKAVTANLKKQSGTIHQVKWSPNHRI